MKKAIWWVISFYLMEVYFLRCWLGLDPSKVESPPPETLYVKVGGFSTPID